MKEAKYDNPRIQFKKQQSKIAVVITFFDAGVKSYWNHFTDVKKKTLLLNLKAHQYFEPGVPYDLIIVDHGGCPIDFNIPGVKIIKAENIGYGFGGWKQAWQRFGEEYDYYCFCEDDIAPTKDGWLLEILQKFLSTGDCGAVGNIVEARSINEGGSDLAWKACGHPNREMMYNFDGGYTFTSTNILLEVDMNFGGLNVVDCGHDSIYAPTTNEIIFQQPIMELGYRLLSFADGEHFLVHGSEILTNDVMYRTGPPAPLLNLNGRHKVPEIAEIFKPIL